jgi:hypothetical protein
MHALLLADRGDEWQAKPSFELDRALVDVRLPDIRDRIMQCEPIDAVYFNMGLIIESRKAADVFTKAPKRAGGEPREITLIQAAEKWDVPKSAWSKAAKRPPDHPSHLPTRKEGRNRYVSLKHAEAFAKNYIARREQKRLAPETQFPRSSTRPRRRNNDLDDTP